MSFAPVPGFSKYVVSSDGRIFGPRRELRSAATPDGYRRVMMIRDDGARVNKSVSRVVLESFSGAAPEGTECAHMDGVRDHNDVSNLAWITPAENHAHKKVHGTSQTGERNGNSKLTADEVPDVRVRLADGEKIASIATRHSVSRRAIRFIETGRTWKHVQ
ncbi:HNH endonuclease [Streptomyces sp. ITFR-6]|uniref:HNH endonuclease n=1 Tax=Streptomyces sp. ITFR-6 TaxID=3075197 RepID=UPI00288A93F8|nr:HNH endonuclease [Streptomyces sp. ITFR-6]WNI28628.1 HNH endonuclease [Streptomyces sp. ITFR-6]